MWSFLSFRNSAGTEVTVGPSTPLPTRGASYTSSATFTRPNNTNAYSAGAVIADSTTAANVLTFANMGPPGGSMLIHYASLEIDVAAVPSGMGGFRVELYDSAPTAINDAAAYNLPAGDRAKHLCTLEFTTPEDLGDTLKVQNDQCRLPAQLAAGSTSLYGILRTVAGFTPTASVVKKITISAVEK